MYLETFYVLGPLEDKPPTDAIPSTTHHYEVPSKHTGLQPVSATDGQKSDAELSAVVQGHQTYPFVV